MSINFDDHLKEIAIRHQRLLEIKPYVEQLHDLKNEEEDLHVVSYATGQLSNDKPRIEIAFETSIFRIYSFISVTKTGIKFAISRVYDDYYFIDKSYKELLDNFLRKAYSKTVYFKTFELYLNNLKELFSLMKYENRILLNNKYTELILKEVK